MKRRASRFAFSPRPVGPRLVGLLALLFIGPPTMAWGAVADSAERNPHKELILLASGSIAGNLDPCG